MGSYRSMRVFIVYTFLFVSLLSYGKERYWFFFKDQLSKSERLEIIDQHNTDKNIKVLSNSNWINALLCESNFEDLRQISKDQSIIEIKKETPLSPQYSLSSNSVTSLLPVIPEIFEANGLTGKNVKIGVADAGFYHADQSNLLKLDSNVIHFKDFVDTTNESIFSRKFTSMDHHGAKVLKHIAGYNSNKKIRWGLANNASFYLARTDHGKEETRSDEANLINALEWLHSKGVRLVNISLGYARDFDDESENHDPKEIDGSSTAITRACQKAVDEKDMILVIAAGNEGNKDDWRVLAAPADAESVISVGATNYDLLRKANYSSIGPETLPYLKPEVSAPSLSGTSYSAPIITGIIACMLEKKPSLSAKEVKNILSRCSSLYPFGNNYIGYGIPNCKKILQHLNEEPIKDNWESIEISRKKISLKFETGTKVVTYAKSTSKNVLNMNSHNIKKRKLKITREQGVMFTTVWSENKVTEIIWE